MERARILIVEDEPQLRGLFVPADSGGRGMVAGSRGLAGTSSLPACVARETPGPATGYWPAPASSQGWRLA